MFTKRCQKEWHAKLSSSWRPPCRISPFDATPGVEMEAGCGTRESINPCVEILIWGFKCGATRWKSFEIWLSSAFWFKASSSISASCMNSVCSMSRLILQDYLQPFKFSSRLSFSELYKSDLVRGTIEIVQPFPRWLYDFSSRMETFVRRESKIFFCGISLNRWC